MEKPCRNGIQSVFMTLIVFLIVASVPTWAAEKKDSLANVHGILKRPQPKFQTAGFDNVYFQKATAMLVQEKSGKLDTSYVVCNDDTFSFTDLRPGKVYLKISHLSYNTEEGIYDLVAGDNVIYFTLKEKVREIEESKVTAEVPLMRILQDTTIYYAAAVPTNEWDSALEIIRQLPGFEVSGETITVNGERVARTYVNGVQIFGNNPVTAFGALYADEVTQVRVYDQQTAEARHKGVKVSRKERVLDIKTKDPILSLASILLSASAGADEAKDRDGKIQPRYDGYAKLDFYSEMLTMSAKADMNNSMNGNRMNIGGTGGINSVGEFDLQPSFSSYDEFAGAKINFDKYWKDREYGNNVGIMYRLDRQYSRSITESLTEYFPGDGIPYMSYEDSLSNSSTSISHNFLASLDLKDTKIEDISISVGGSISEARNRSLSSTLNRTEGEADRSQFQDTGSDGRNYEIDTYIQWSKTDNSKFIPSVSLHATMYSNNSLSWDTDTLASSFTRRQLQTDGIGKGFMAYAQASVQSYLVNNDRMSLSGTVGYTFQYDKTRRRQMTYDFLDNPTDPALYMASSYDYDWNMMTNDVALGLTMDLRKVSMNLGVKGGRVTQTDDERFPEAVSYDRGYTKVEPAFGIRYGMHNFSISCSATQPSLQQTRDRIDDSNPLVLTAGNPDLKQVYSTEAKLGGMIYRNMKTGMTLMYNAGATYVANSIVSRSRYFTQDTHIEDYGGYDVKAGSMLYTYANTGEGVWRANVSLPFSAMFRKTGLTVHAAPEGYFETAPQYVGESLSTMVTARAGITGRVQWRPGGFSFTMRPRIYWFNSDNTSGRHITSGWQVGGGLYATYTFPFGMYINADAEDMYFKYLSGAGTDNNVLQLKCSIGCSFLQNSLKVSLSAMDLLNRGSSYTTTSTSNYFKQEWKPTYGRYYMLTVVYEFRHKKG